MINKKRDIVWMLLDGLRIDYLEIENQQESKKHSIEAVLLQGRLYTTVIAAMKFSLGATYASGTGLYGSVNGMNGYDYNLGKAKPGMLYMGDYLKTLGYHIFHYSDACWRNFPSSGIDLYEFSNHGGIASLPGRSFDTPRRRHLIESFKNTDSPKFLFLHLDTLHDMSSLIARKGNIWYSEGYKKAIQWLARDLRTVLKQLELTGDELLVLSTDHGTILDKDYLNAELREGTSMKPESLRTFCSFISSDITPGVLNKRCASIDILPTIFELAGLPAIPVQGNSLVSTAGTSAPISEGVGRFEFPFDRTRPKAYSIYEDEWKLVIKSGRGKKLYSVKDGVEKEEKVSDYPDVTEALESKLYKNLSTSANEIRNKKITALKSQGKEVLPLTRADLPIRIVLFMSNYDMDSFDSLVCCMKSQMEHYFHLHLFDADNGDYHSEDIISELDPRIKIHNEELQVESIVKILEAYNKPEFVGFVNSSIEYYEDYLYRLRRLHEENPEAYLAWAKLENGSEYVFLARAQLIKRLIEQGMSIEDLLVLPEHNFKKVEYKYPLGTYIKKRIIVCPLDKSTTELLKVEGIGYIERGSQQEKQQLDIIACSTIENVQTAQDLANLHQSTAVYIDYNTSTNSPNVLPSITLKVLKRERDAWLVMDGKTGIRKEWLWQALEECVTKKYLGKNATKIESVLVKIHKLIMKMSCLPLLRSYQIRKLLLSIHIGKIELSKESPPTLKRQNPYTKCLDRNIRHK